MEDSMTPGCRLRLVAACKDGICLAHWNITEKVERCEKPKDPEWQEPETGPGGKVRL